MKKILKWSGLILGSIIILIMLFGESSEERLAREAKQKVTADSIETIKRLAIQTRDSIHNYRIKNDNAYRDSLENAQRILKEKIAAEEKERIEFDKRVNPQNYITVAKSGWEEGGFGKVALATFTLKNESLRDVGDIKMKFTFRGESGTILRSEEKVIPIVVKKGQSKTVRKENLGFYPQNSSTMSTEFVSIGKYLD